MKDTRDPDYRSEYVAQGAMLKATNAVLRRSRLLIVVPLTCVAVAVVFALLRSPGYRAESAFVPQAENRNLSQLAGLAAQFGVDLMPAADAAESPDFYVSLLQSRELLLAVASTTFAVPAGEAGQELKGDLFRLLEVDDRTDARRERRMVRLLRERTRASPDPKTSMVRVSVKAPWPSLAVAVNARLLELVNAFNLQTRQSKSRAERRFVEQRLEEARTSLAATENALRRFLEQNRQYSASPQLSFQQMRLQRQVDLQQQLYTSLMQSYQQARIEEVRNLPLITIIDRPEGSAYPLGRNIVLSVVLAAITGLFVGVMIALVYEYFRRQRVANPADFAEFIELRRHAVSTLIPRLRHIQRRRTAVDAQVAHGNGAEDGSADR